MKLLRKEVSYYNNIPGHVLKSPDVPPQVIDCIKKCDVDPEKVIGYQMVTSKGFLSTLFSRLCKKPERTIVTITTIENGVKHTYTRSYTPKSP
jgi:hypothetical protein